mgnify:CR=1 FL=1
MPGGNSLTIDPTKSWSQLTLSLDFDIIEQTKEWSKNNG